MSKKIIVFGSFAASLIKFRYQLLEAMVNNGYEVIACAPEADNYIISKLSEINVQYQNVPLSRTGINPISDIKNLWNLSKIFKEINPDYILSYTIKPVIYGSLAAQLAGVKNIYSMVTGLGYAFTNKNIKSRVVNKIVSWLLKIALKFNKVVFFQNPDDIAIFFEKNLLRANDQPYMINGSGVDLNHYENKPLPDKFSFLLIARLNKDKGIIEYADAARDVKKKHPNIKFYLAGWIDSNPSAIKQEMLDDWINSGVIDFIGRLDDVRPAIENCSVYVLPSYREGTPRTVLEAMAMGRAIITTDAPGCRETVKEGWNGYLVPVKSVELLILRMKKLIEEPELLTKMSQRSYELAQEKYDVHKVNIEIMKKMKLI